ncbi:MULTISPECIES: carboxypeptidase regulatory-like domain-containing protein [Acidobacteriaceae]|uniref:carboxypeptidase regulatory-like domain-containing protein n=1 Tax=Acidobacteriaceae TaxID=204434 RepID=UPI00131A6CCD|nr:MULTISPECIES: carboxypeptidase regulatory-like domain-containing protein [Acidobacteriaceae]MDW5265037.1 carboxypeptidase regulatory-like domain-containing protein [Edaphobacter sp.]
MKRTSLLQFLIFSLVASASFAVAQTKAAAAISYRITGILVSSADGAPIPHGHLTATLVPRGADGEGDQFPSPLGTFDADEHGRFLISLPSAGMWRVVGSARGYVTQAYDEHQLFSSGIVLTAASPVADLRFQLPPESVITGKLMDEAGEAVRNAQVSLLAIPPPGPDSSQPAARARASTSTDDRGSYEFDGLQPGDYRIKVQAQVWYAIAAQQTASNAESDQHPLDPSLDVTYPLTWYPGTSDSSEAETLTLHAGDSRQADFQLAPIPSVHLHIVPEVSADANGRRIQTYPMIERISDEGNDFVPVSAHIGPQGTIDVGGLAPGQYEVRMQGPGQTIKPAIIDLTEGSTQTLDMSAASAMASVSIHLDGLAGADVGSVRVNFIDPENGRNVARDNAGGYFLSGSLLQRRRQDASGQTIEIPPGRYEIVLAGRPNLYLTRITAQSAQANGRFVTVPSGSSTLTLHIADGRSTLTGIAMMQGKPSVGAMVLLIPATLGEPDNLNIIRRDQTNTDGSFELNNVLPGQYILFAIDHGWEINWKDPSTLRGYMMHGTPVDLTSMQKLKETVEAQAP